MDINAIEEFRAGRVEAVGDGPPTVSNGFSPERLDLSGVSYMSAQRIGELVESPRHYWWKYIKGNKSPDTPAKILGKLTHWALLQPNEFLARYVIEKEFSGKGSVAAYNEWAAALPKSAIVMTRNQAQLINNMIEAIMSNSDAAKLLSKGTPEVHTFYKDHEFKDEKGLPLQWFGIMDFYRSGNWIVEVKTTKCAEKKSFRKDYYKFGHHHQIWKYRRMVEGITGSRPNCMTIAVENTGPHSVQVFEVDPPVFDTANYEITLALEDWRQGMLSGVWPSYSKDPVNVGFPAPWQASRFEDDEEGEFNG